MKSVDIAHYVETLKRHEANHASTNERNKYWQSYKN